MGGPALRHVVVPIDFSSSSIAALQAAGRIAYGGDTELTLLHVYPYACDVDPVEAPYIPRVARMSPQAREAAISGLSRLAGRIRPPVSRIRIVVREGDPSTEILNFAERCDVDLLAMGTHGRRGFDRLVLGSVTERVTQRASCSVLTARDGAPGDAMRSPAFTRIVCAVDLGADSVPTIEAAVGLAQATGAAVTVAHVVSASREEDRRRSEQPHEPEYPPALGEAQERLRHLVRLTQDPNTDIDVVVVRGGRCTEIDRIRVQSEAGLLVLGSGGGRVGERAPFGSTVQHLLRHAACPVVVARATHRPALRAGLRLDAAVKV